MQDKIMYNQLHLSHIYLALGLLLSSRVFIWQGQDPGFFHWLLNVKPKENNKHQKKSYVFKLDETGYHTISENYYSTEQNKMEDVKLPSLSKKS